MTDRISKESRRYNMRAVRSRNTRPEILVRHIVHSLGYRFRLHPHELPGKPDIAFPRHQKVIFVNGCFWHQHKGCPRANLPKTNTRFWRTKLTGNVVRDTVQLKAIRKCGWR